MINRITNNNFENHNITTETIEPAQPESTTLHGLRESTFLPSTAVIPKNPDTEQSLLSEIKELYAKYVRYDRENIIENGQTISMVPAPKRILNEHRLAAILALIQDTNRKLEELRVLDDSLDLF